MVETEMSLYVSLWIHLRVVQLKAGDNAHRRIALFAHVACCFSPSSLFVTADGAVPLYFVAINLHWEVTLSEPSKWLWCVMLWCDYWFCLTHVC